MKITRSERRTALRMSALGVTICATLLTSYALADAPKKPEVSRAQFTSRVLDREPIDSIERLSNERTSILFYSELRGLAGTTVRHRWEREGEPMAEVPFRVEANRWRVWSSKNLEPSALGTWTVSVVAADETVLATRSFTYHPK